MEQKFHLVADVYTRVGTYKVRINEKASSISVLEQLRNKMQQECSTMSYVVGFHINSNLTNEFCFSGEVWRNSVVMYSIVPATVTDPYA